MAAGFRVTAILAVLLLAAACAPRQRQAASLPEPTQPPASSQWIGRDIIQAACLNDLAATGAKFELIAQAEAGKDGCTLQNGVRLIATSVDLVRPAEMTCPMALRLMQFEKEVLVPEAQRVFGQPLKQINHAGAFTCKRMTGNSSRISEHGHGRAIDIWGFVLADGRRVSVADHFRSQGREGQYLRGVNREACKFFSVVLGPNADAAHAKSFHWDIGPWNRCGS
ncbi:extensin family protein [Ferrovibrio terrae]|uniref:extensin-like domain-containing protein n=1 Tax=Ferrovibrio terrae TaxID=2594003 RepID=UPI003137FB5B